MKSKGQYFYKKLISLLFIFTVCFASAVTPVHAQEAEEEEIPIQTLEELEQAIADVLEETGLPGVGIALVNKEGPFWIKAFGKADVEENIDATEDTMFRIGSISKMFVSLSVLKLVEEGKLSLDDKLSDLAPEIEYENQWEETNPIRIVHLLEHTTGWDDMHTTEYAHSDPTPVKLKEGLDYHPHSRISRWRPGTRSAYCNSGPPVAAYIVEKLTGVRFEEYVEKHFFKPMAMNDTTYFLTDTYKKLGASLYINEAKQPYWHIVLRPSGSINSSSREMAQLLHFLINRGRVGERNLVSQESLQRMETAGSTLAAKAGMTTGYGLGNYTTAHDPFVFNGHDGGVNGGASMLGYIAEQGVGYVMLINGSDFIAMQQISDLLKNFVTKDLIAPEMVKTQPLTEQQKQLSGYYVNNNPRIKSRYFLERLISVVSIKISGDDKMIVKAIMPGSEPMTYLATGDYTFRLQENNKDNFALVKDPEDGWALQNGFQSLKPTSGVVVWTQIAIAILWLIILISTSIQGLIFGIAKLRGKLPKGLAGQVRLWPVWASYTIVATVILSMAASDDAINNFGNVTFWSVTALILSVAFALASLKSIYVIFKARGGDIGKWIYGHAALASSLHMIVMLYLLYWGGIGVPSWV